MARFVLKTRGHGATVAEARAVIARFSDITVEEFGASQMLVSGPAPSVRQLTSQLTGWFSAPVRTVQPPAIGAMRHPRVRKPA